MIRKEEVYKIGRITKLHGIKGEVVLKYQLDIQGQYASMREMRIRFAPSRRA